MFQNNVTGNKAKKKLALEIWRLTEDVLESQINTVEE